MTISGDNSKDKRKTVKLKAEYAAALEELKTVTGEYEYGRAIAKAVKIIKTMKE